MTTTSIPVPEGFAFAATVESHGWRHLAPFRWSRDTQQLQRSEELNGKVRELAINFDGKALIVRGAPDSQELRRRISRMFQLSVDLSEFLQMSARSATHSWLPATGFGRLLCGSTLFEDIVKIIATTNTMWAQTVRMVALLVDKCGTRSARGLAAFPSPAAVARISAEELQLDCRLGYRARSISLLARGIEDGSIDLDAIANPSQPTEELLMRYRTLPGIGPYGAAHLLAMDGRHDFIAVDTEFRRFVSEQYHHGRRVSDATMLRHYARWGRWKYLAYWSELHRGMATPLHPSRRVK